MSKDVSIICPIHACVFCSMKPKTGDRMLESYVTPLLMSYVNKYIKNLKPSDLQLSLWGGDVVLSKLDLKLDVLEQVWCSVLVFALWVGTFTRQVCPQAKENWI